MWAAKNGKPGAPAKIESPGATGWRLTLWRSANRWKRSGKHLRKVAKHFGQLPLGFGYHGGDVIFPAVVMDGLKIPSAVRTVVRCYLDGHEAATAAMRFDF